MSSTWFSFAILHTSPIETLTIENQTKTFASRQLPKKLKRDFETQKETKAEGSQDRDQDPNNLSQDRDHKTLQISKLTE